MQSIMTLVRHELLQGIFRMEKEVDKAQQSNGCQCQNKYTEN